MADQTEPDGEPGLDEFPQASPLAAARLDLEPLQVEHAEEMAPLLSDLTLYAYIGGEPVNLAGLRERYRRQAAGRSPDGSQRWLNWVVRRRCDGAAIGTVQATITQERNGVVAEVAWVIATPHQGHGYAREAAGAMVAWLRTQGVGSVLAHVHPDHQASQNVCHAIGLTATKIVIDGEIRWKS